MKRTSRFLVIAAVALSAGILGPTTFAQRGGFGGGGGFHGGFHGGGFHGGGSHNGFRGSFFFGFPFGYAPYPYYYDPYYYYPPSYYYTPTYYSSPAVYSSQPAYVYDSSQQQSVDRPLSPTAVDRDSSPPPPPPSLGQRDARGQSISVDDVKALVKADVSDEVIFSHIRNSQAVYHLTTAEIIDLKKSGVDDKVIDFMINTSSAYR